VLLRFRFRAPARWASTAVCVSLTTACPINASMVRRARLWWAGSTVHARSDIMVCIANATTALPTHVTMLVLVPPMSLDTAARALLVSMDPPARLTGATLTTVVTALHVVLSPIITPVIAWLDSMAPIAVRIGATVRRVSTAPRVTPSSISTIARALSVITVSIAMTIIVYRCPVCMVCVRRSLMITVVIAVLVTMVVTARSRSVRPTLVTTVRAVAPPLDLLAAVCLVTMVRIVRPITASRLHACMAHVLRCPTRLFARALLVGSALPVIPPLITVKSRRV
jgi:hypothetical protein